MITAGAVAVLRVTATVSHWTVRAVSNSALALGAPGSMARHGVPGGAGWAVVPRAGADGEVGQERVQADQARSYLGAVGVAEQVPADQVPFVRR